MSGNRKSGDWSYCPACGGSIDTGYECNQCGRDWLEFHETHKAHTPAGPGELTRVAIERLGVHLCEENLSGVAGKILAHDADLRAERDALKSECRDLNNLKAMVAKIAEGLDPVKVLTEGMVMVLERDIKIADLTCQVAEAHEKHDYLRPHFDAAIEERNQLQEANGSLIKVVKELRGQLAASEQIRLGLAADMDMLTKGY